MSGPVVPLSAVYFCQDVMPDVACDGPFGPFWSGVAWLQSGSWVQYAVPTSGGCGSLPYPSPGVGTFAPINALPSGACLVAGSSLGLTVSPNGYVAASALAFGGNGIYSPPFDISQLDGPTMSEAFSAGLILVAMGFIVAKPIQLLLQAIRSW